MNYNFDGSVKNSLEKSLETSVTVFKKKDEGWEKLLDPFYNPEQKPLQRINTWHQNISLRMTVNHPIGEKACKVTKIENGTVNGPTKVDNFRWDVEVTADKEGGANVTTVEIEIADDESAIGREPATDSEPASE